MRKYITFPRVAGTASRQSHCDLPKGTYEREFGREGFFGPVTQLHHTHKPTGWIAWEGELRPRAYDLTKFTESSTSSIDIRIMMTFFRFTKMPKTPIVKSAAATNR